MHWQHFEKLTKPCIKSRFFLPFLPLAYRQPLGSTIYCVIIVSLFCSLFFCDPNCFPTGFLFSRSPESPKVFGECVKCNTVWSVMHLYLGNDFMYFTFKARALFFFQ